MKGNDRLKPTVFHTRYVHLTKLRIATLENLRDITGANKNVTLIDFGCGDMPYRSVIEPMVGKYLGVDLDINLSLIHISEPTRH